MTEKKLDRWFDERVEAFVDGELPDNERRMFAARLALDDDLKTAVERARRLSAALGRMPVLECPDQMARAVFQMTRARPRMPLFGWAMAAAMALAVGVGVSRYLAVGPGDGGLEPAPNAEQLAQARADLALALAYLDRAGQVAAREVGEQVVTRGMRDPVSAGMAQGRHALQADGEAI